MVDHSPEVLASEEKASTTRMKAYNMALADQSLCVVTLGLPELSRQLS